MEDQGFLDLLKDLLSDPTPMVVANTVAALAEIGEVSPTGEKERKGGDSPCLWQSEGGCMLFVQRDVTDVM